MPAFAGGQEPDIVEVGPGSWAIVDAGRGLRYKHLTQKENQEKRLTRTSSDSSAWV
ncbi:MAG TPA: hypothetical protein VG247_03820 [Pseudonocardiaceae bacterium]|nr:hypothetical protein [Pseudonocardiaceae bacterium]